MQHAKLAWVPERQQQIKIDSFFTIDNEMTMAPIEENVSMLESKTFIPDPTLSEMS